MDRVDSFVKVTGSAQYAAEYNLPGVTYGVIVTSTIANAVYHATGQRIRHLPIIPDKLI